MLFKGSAGRHVQVLHEEGFEPHGGLSNSRTILMDLKPPLDQLRAAMQSHWKRELRVAEKKALQVEEGTDDPLFGAMIGLHRELVARKRFSEGNDITAFRRLQSRLPDSMKMRVMLCRSGPDLMSGLVISAIGGTGVYLFGATSNKGMKSRGSYLLQWLALQRMKAEGLTSYDLNGINPSANPGTYTFKSELAGANGQEVEFLGRYEAHVRGCSRAVLQVAETARAAYGAAKRLMRKASPPRG